MTDETNTTPGPWGIWSDQNGRYAVGPSINLKVADLYHPPLGGAAENAKLIAASPDMLKALKSARMFIMSVPEVVTVSGDAALYAIDQAIDRAEGRSK